KVYAQLLDRSPVGLIYAIYAPSIPAFATLAREQTEGLVWSTVSGTYADQFGTDFIDRFSTRYNSRPGHSQAGLAYDMVNIIASAWKDANDSRDVESSLEALRHTRYRGVNGSYIYSRHHQTSLSYPDQTKDPSVGKAQLVFQIQQGEHRCIAPEPYADGTLHLPPWMQP